MKHFYSSFSSSYLFKYWRIPWKTFDCVYVLCVPRFSTYPLRFGYWRDLRILRLWTMKIWWRASDLLWPRFMLFTRMRHILLLLLLLLLFSCSSSDKLYFLSRYCASTKASEQRNTQKRGMESRAASPAPKAKKKLTAAYQICRKRRTGLPSCTGNLHTMDAILPSSVFTFQTHELITSRALSTMSTATQWTATWWIGIKKIEPNGWEHKLFGENKEEIFVDMAEGRNHFPLTTESS